LTELDATSLQELQQAITELKAAVKSLSESISSVVALENDPVWRSADPLQFQKLNLAYQILSTVSSEERALQYVKVLKRISEEL